MPATTAQDAWIEQVLGVRRAAGPGSFVALRQARLQWDAARKQARAEVQLLEAEILRRFARKPFGKEITANIYRLYEMFETLDERLLDELDAALRASDPGVRTAHHQKAAAIAAAYRRFVDGDVVVQAIDANPIRPVAACKVLTETLTALERQLA
jgi:hypothetical protein